MAATMKDPKAPPRPERRDVLRGILATAAMIAAPLPAPPQPDWGAPVVRHGITWYPIRCQDVGSDVWEPDGHYAEVDGVFLRWPEGAATYRVLEGA